jgi:hypothetical protein
MLHMSTTYLPVNNRWFDYVQSSRDACTKIEHSISIEIGRLAKAARARLQDNNEYTRDPWMWNEDWACTKKGGRPNWLRILCGNGDKTADQEEESTKSSRSRTVPRLLQMCWAGRPLVHMPAIGWAYWLINHDALADLQQRSSCIGKKLEFRMRNDAARNKEEALRIIPIGLVGRV